jgi:hypothetical protein
VDKKTITRRNERSNPATRGKRGKVDDLVRFSVNIVTCRETMAKLRAHCVRRGVPVSKFILDLAMAAIE